MRGTKENSKWGNMKVQIWGEKFEPWLQNFKILQLLLHCASTATFHVLIWFFIDSMPSKKQGTSKTISAYKKGSNSAIEEPSIDRSYCKCLASPVFGTFFSRLDIWDTLKDCENRLWKSHSSVLFKKNYILWCAHAV